MSNTIEYIYDSEHVVDSNKEFFDYEMRHTKNRYIGWFFVALTQFAIVAALKYHSFSLLIFSTFALVYWYYLRWQIKKFFLIRGFKDSPLKDTTICVSFDKKALHVNESEISLESINKVKETEVGFLVYLVNSSLFFSKSSFIDRKVVSKFRAIFLKE